MIRVRAVWQVLLCVLLPAVTAQAATDGLPLLLWSDAAQRAALADGQQVTVMQPPQPEDDASGRPAGTAGTSGWRAVGTVAAPGVQHLAAGPDDGTVYASAGQAGVLKFIRLDEGRQVHQVPAAGALPGPLVYHPVLKRLASFNAQGSVTLFDTASRAYEGLLPLGETPASAVLAPDGRVLAVLPEQRVLALLALRPFRMFGRFDLPQSCVRPGELLVDAAAGRVFVDCGAHTLALFDYRQGAWQPDWQWPGVDSAPRHLLFDAVHARVLALQADGALLQAGATAADTRLLRRLPAGSAAAWSTARQALVVASPDTAMPFTFQFSFLQVP